LPLKCHLGQIKKDIKNEDLGPKVYPIPFFKNSFDFQNDFYWLSEITTKKHFLLVIGNYIINIETPAIFDLKKGNLLGLCNTM
jgi:hypothetical protein